jgi:nitrate/nitrite-specific signal transduction histidine kinase
VEPPHASITVQDDGIGMRGDARPGSYGLAIMRERADRLRAQLSVQPRAAGGTTVNVHLGSVDKIPWLHGGGEERGAGPDADDGAARR